MTVPYTLLLPGCCNTRSLLENRDAFQWREADLLPIDLKRCEAHQADTRLTIFLRDESKLSAHLQQADDLAELAKEFEVVQFEDGEIRLCDNFREICNVNARSATPSSQRSGSLLRTKTSRSPPMLAA